MPDGSPRHAQGQIGSLLVCAFFILAGVVTLYDASHYVDRDSQVFPQTAAIILIATASLALVQRLLRPSSEGGFGQGSWWRRGVLLAAMLLCCAAMPVIGFWGAGVLAFAGCLWAAMHDRWTAQTAVLYTGSGLLIVTAFYAIFKYALHVPLP